MATEAQRAACRRYYERTKKNTKVLVFRLNKTLDKDIIEAFDAVPSKTAYLRKLVRGE